MRGSLLAAFLVFGSMLAGCAGNGTDTSSQRPCTAAAATTGTQSCCGADAICTCPPSTCITYTDCGYPQTASPAPDRTCFSYVDCQPGHGALAQGVKCKPGSSTTTSAAANVPPVIVMKVTDGNGTATNVTRVGGTLFFDASGSTDTDGDGLSAIAMVAVDSNGTLLPLVLYSKGAFRPGNYTFSHAGPVNVTASGIDGRGDVTTVGLQVFVDSRVVVGETFQFSAAEPDAVASAKSCKGPSGQASADSLVWTKDNFDLENGTTYVTATILSGKAEIALCAPDGTAVSDESTTTVTSTAGTAFTHAAGVAGYYVSVYSGAAQQKVPVEVVVHYEPQVG